jgi:hypothetical protein
MTYRRNNMYGVTEKERSDVLYRLKDDHWQIRKNAHEAIKKIESQPEKNIRNNR